MGYYFDRDYIEEARLNDGTKVQLRCIRPEDKALLVEGFKHLSEETKYRRFFTAKSGLSESELVFLTEVDGFSHFALGAKVITKAGDMGVGIARFIRNADDPDVAEPAIVIVDEEQGKGLGHILFLRLVAAARERGVKRFRCEILASNDPVRNLLSEVPSYHRVEQKGEEDEIEFDIPELAPYADDYDDRPGANPFVHISKAIRAGQLHLKNRLFQLFSGDWDHRDPRDLLLKKRK